MATNMRPGQSCPTHNVRFFHALYNENKMTYATAGENIIEQIEIS